MEICELRENDETKWDEYVFKSNSSTFFHQIGWKNVIQKTYGHKPYYLIAKENNCIEGILPLFFIESIIFGKRFVSVPYAPYGGILADNETIEFALVDAAIKLMQELNAKVLELRYSQKPVNNNKLNSNSKYVTSILELDQDIDEILMKRLNRNKRKSIYKSQKKGLVLDWTNETKEFYNLFVHNMRNLGSPSHSEQFFKNILSEFPDNSKILTVNKDDITIYVSFYLFYKDTLINSWSSALDKYRNIYPTDFGIWSAIEYGCKNGYKYYDFGRSQIGSANFEFKRRWGAEAKELNYQYYLYNSEKMPDNTSSNTKRRLFAKIWKNVPIGVASIFGPYFRKEIP